MKEIIIDRACGLDVHKANVTACIKGKNLKKEIRTFGTTTNELIEFKNWLKKNRITHLAMESTGVYWKPVFNILEDYKDLQLLLVNARHIKHVPGRKTDVKDSEWLCKLLRSGLLKGSFIPPKDIRNLRDLTRYERKLQNQQTRIKNRIHKLLHECNIKISNVITDIFGVTGLKILNDLASGNTDAISLSEHFLSVKRLEKKQKEAQEALNGRVTDHHQYILKSMLKEMAFVKENISEINNRVEEIITKTFWEEKRLLNTIPGISDKASHTIISELGVNMDVFPTSNHASSWAGLCPGNNESAGKKKALV